MKNIIYLVGLCFVAGKHRCIVCIYKYVSHVRVFMKWAFTRNECLHTFSNTYVSTILYIIIIILLRIMTHFAGYARACIRIQKYYQRDSTFVNVHLQYDFNENRIIAIYYLHAVAVVVV